MRSAFFEAAFKENQDGATHSLFILIRPLQASGVEARVWANDRNENTGNDCVEKHSVHSLPLPICLTYRISLSQNKLIRHLRKSIALATLPPLLLSTIPGKVRA